MSLKKSLSLTPLIILAIVCCGCNGGGNTSNAELSSVNGSKAGSPQSNGEARTVVIWWDITLSLFEAEKDKGLDWAGRIISNLPPNSSYFLLPIHSETERPAPLAEGVIPLVNSEEARLSLRANLKKRISENVGKLKESIKKDEENAKRNAGHVPRDKRTCILKTIDNSASFISNQNNSQNPEIIYISDMIEDCYHQSLSKGEGGFIQLAHTDIAHQIESLESMNFEPRLKDLRVTVLIPTATDSHASYQRPEMENLKRFWRRAFEKSGLPSENLHWSVGSLPPRLMNKN